MLNAERLIEFLRSKKIQIYFTLLGSFLVLVYFPTFFNAPRSDWWETLYFFHNIYANPGTSQWLDIFNTDCFGHVTFRPLSHLLLYAMHLVFGSKFIYVHFLNFCTYFINILLIYKLAANFIANKVVSMIAICFFAFLFSHFDIVSWTAHYYVIFGLSMSLCGLLSYIRFLNTDRKIFLFFSVIYFLPGILCYEAFAFWPLSLIILGHIKTLRKKEGLAESRVIRSYSLVIFIVYVLYIIIFSLTRIIPTYADTWVQTRSLFQQSLNYGRIAESIYAASFNILYNNVLVNIVPLFAWPVWINPESSNIQMGGVLMRHNLEVVHMQMATLVLFVSTGLIVIRLFINKRFEVLKVFLFIFFLLFSYTFLIFHLKHFSNNEYFYSFRQFRYQYVPNMCAILVAALFSDILNNSRRKNSIRILCFLLFVPGLLNIYGVINHVSLEARQMEPLNMMLNNIRRDIKSGKISAGNKIYLDDSIVDAMPVMCWNREMGKQFMKRTYQWIFDRREIKCFSDNIEDAMWIVKPDKNFAIIKNIRGEHNAEE